MQKKILIADDEPRMRKLVADFLKREGYQVLEAEEGKHALEIFAEDSIDLIILDVMMPKYDGWTVLREIRKSSVVPVIMLTARGEESDELFGFKLGADEYISKPFSPKILVARVQAILRRGVEEKQGHVEIEGLKIELEGRSVSLDDAPIELSAKEFELLAYLVQNPAKVLTRDQILNAVWGYGTNH